MYESLTGVDWCHNKRKHDITDLLATILFLSIKSLILDSNGVSVIRVNCHSLDVHCSVFIRFFSSFTFIIHRDMDTI